MIGPIPGMEGRDFTSGTLTTGAAVTVGMAGASLPCTVWVDVTAGDTVTVTYKSGSTSTAQAWPNGAATAYSEDVLDAPIVSVTFQRTAGAGVTSKYGITT